MVSPLPTSPHRPIAVSPMRSPSPRPRFSIQHSEFRIRRAFTLIELMVAVSLLVVIILSVGIVFKSTGNAVGLGQATGEMFAKVRAINQQIVSDVHGMDRNGFLIIRCRAERQGDFGFSADRFRRHDQISFISTGKFPNRTGAYQQTQVFADNSTANSARIWYGQLIVAKDPWAAPAGTDLPTSAVLNTADPAYESGFWLGRQAMLLLNPPAAGASEFPAGFTDINLTLAASYSGTPHPSNNGPESSVASTPITMSRVDVAYTTLPQIMANLSGGFPNQPDYCYRLKTLPSPTTTGIADASGNPYLPNGVLRMHPVFATGLPSFAIDWTDGTPDGNGNLKWFGWNTGQNGSYSVELAPPADGSRANFPNNGNFYKPPAGLAGTEFSDQKIAKDNYEVVFTPANSTLWPKALRFTYRITDSNDRLNGGRSFVCVVDLPPPLHN